MFNKYYDEELRFLREDGREFAKKYPAARHLFEAGGDPDVERLLEGTALLCGRIRQQMDEGLPEISHGLLQLIHPHFLRPLPRASILAFEPIAGRLPSHRTHRTVPKFTEVRSTARTGTVYRFRTTRDVTLHPFTLVDATERTVAGERQLRLEFRALPGAKFDAEATDLPVYLHGVEALETYRWLCRHARRVELVRPHRATSVELDLPQPEGLASVGELFPYPTMSYFGFRLLQEFFAFAQTFAFVTFRGLVLDSSDQQFELVVTVDQPRRSASPLTRDDLRLYCTPIVNLFEADSEPVRFDSAKSEYLLSASSGHGDEIVSVDGAVGWVSGTAEQRRLRPFFAFDLDASVTDACYYHIRMREPLLVQAAGSEPGRSTVHDARVFASFVDLARRPVSTLQTSLVVFKLTCCNGSTGDEPRVGDISEPSDTSPEFARFSNVAPVSAPVPVPWTENAYWTLLSHLSLNHLSLENVQAFKSLLRTYNWQHLHSAQLGLPGERCIAALERVECGSAERVVTEALWPDEPEAARFGTLVRGRSVTLTFREQDLSPGELFLFGSVLNTFLGSYCSVNSFSQLAVIAKPSETTYTWPPQLGHQRLL